MKLKIEWLGTEYINKTIEVPDSLVVGHTGHWAMNEIYLQEFHDLKDNVVFYQRTEKELKQTIKTASSSMSIGVFAAPNFIWFAVPRGVIEQALVDKENKDA